MQVLFNFNVYFLIYLCFYTSFVRVLPEFGEWRFAQQDSDFLPDFTVT